MWRPFFLALGIYSVMLGLECMVVDRAVMAQTEEHGVKAVAQRMAPKVRQVVPPDWAPWSLLSGGAVVILYTFTIPEKMKA